MSVLLHLLKQGSDVEELCVMYGVLSVLNDNGIPARLSQQKSAWVIECDAFDSDELVIFPLEHERELRHLAIAGMINNRGFEVIMKKMFGEDKDGNDGYFSRPECIRDFVDYLKTGDVSLIQKKRHGLTDEKQTFIGTFFGALGQRSPFKSSMALTVPAPIKYWSTLGYIRATSAVNINQNLEVTWLPVPSQQGISEVGRKDWHPMKENEAGELSRSNYMRTDGGYIGYAQVMLGLHEWAMTGEHAMGYDGFVFAHTHPTGQMSMNGRVERTYRLPLSADTLFNLKDFFRPYVDYDLKVKLAFLLTNRQDRDFTQFIHTLAKDTKKSIAQRDAEELTDMFNQAEVFNQTGVRQYGKMLRRLMYLNKGYDIQKDLIGVTSPEDLTRVLSQLGLVASRLDNRPNPLSIGDVAELMYYVQDNSKRAQNVARMILLHATVHPEQQPKETPISEGDQTDD